MPAQATTETGFRVEELEGRNWESVIDRFTQDMDPWSVDILTLAERYKNYLERMEDLDLEIPARLIVVCAALLKLKVELMQEARDEPRQEHDDMVMEEAWEEESTWQDEIEVPDRTLEPPVKNNPRRRVSLDELKDALEKAVNIQEQRRERQLEREDEEFLEIEEKDITDKLEMLMDRLTGMFSSSDKIPFEQILEQKNREEKIEKFTHILHLETDDKIRCKQDEFFGDIEIYPADDLN